jgi:hypothetical protein
MTPNYKPDLLFDTIKTAIIKECFFCEEPIDPAINHEHFTVTLPGKKTIMSTHVDCFEQLAWSMLNYVVKSIKRHEVKVLH